MAALSSPSESGLTLTYRWILPHHFAKIPGLGSQITFRMALCLLAQGR